MAGILNNHRREKVCHTGGSKVFIFLKLKTDDCLVKVYSSNNDRFIRVYCHYHLSSNLLCVRLLLAPSP